MKKQYHYKQYPTEHTISNIDKARDKEKGKN